MKLKFHSSYLSIKEFPETELPEFTLITGLNGSGKSHLLRAIDQGYIKVEEAPDHGDDIRYFDWNDMVPKDTGMSDGQALVKARTQLYSNFEKQFYQHSEPIVQAARSAGLSGQHLTNIQKTASLSFEELSYILCNNTDTQDAFENIQSAVEASSKKIRNSINKDQHSLLESIASQVEKPIALLTKEDFYANMKPNWSVVGAFQQSFAELFVTYRDLRLFNWVKQFQMERGRHDVDALTEEEFVQQYMAPPWDFVNESLRIAGLDFEIDHPDEFSFSPYQPKLTKRTTGAEVLFNGLSSGEKILMSFALCLYYAQERRQLSTYPKLLLLDEIDAPLHPSMTKSLIQTITDTLIKKHDVNVIAATHSPSTVALAPESAIHVMEVNRPGLHRTSKSQALNILTVGVPTLALNYEGRRQVFVESENDAIIFDKVFQILKPHLASECSLHFVPTGKKFESGTDINTGCQLVYSIVEKLSKAGNGSVFGLVDWDGKNPPTERIAILANGERDGLENVLLDPLLVAALLLRSTKVSGEILGLEKDITYTDFLELSRDQLQIAVNRVTTSVLGEEPTKVRQVSYVGGLSLSVDSSYLILDDHHLEEKILNKYPELNEFSRNTSGKLLLYMTDSVLREKPDFIPNDLYETFDLLLSKENHPEDQS